MEYTSPNDARTMPGLRLALSIGVPGPWGEAAKAIFGVKGIDYVPVAQLPGQPNEDLVAWTGHRNAPTAVYENEPPRVRWHEILALAERLQPDPPLIPRDERERVEMAGICHEIASEDGFGWNRRIGLIASGLQRPEATEAQRDANRAFGAFYGYRDDLVERAVERQIDVLTMLCDTRASEARRGSPYLIGDALSAADIYCAAFAALIEPLPAEVCPMPNGLRRAYSDVEPRVLASLDTASLLEHRDYIYERHIGLPLDF